MKPGALLINTGRGQLIKTKALVNGLKKNKIGGAGLDVYEEEAEYFFEDFSSSTIGDDVLARLMTFPNVLITSHQGFFTQEALHNIAETTLQNIQDFFDDKTLDNEICYQCNGKCLKPGQKRCW
jgi:D-lactate dehydrogenase